MADLQLPPVLQGLFFSFRWDKRVLWSLPTASDLVEISELTWHLALPVWSTRPSEPLFDLSPATVINHRERHEYHWNRIERANVSYPLEMFENHGRWVIMDGYHRLARLVTSGVQQVRVRKHPAAYLGQIIV